MRRVSWRLLLELIVCLGASVLPVTAQAPTTTTSPIAHSVTSAEFNRSREPSLAPGTEVIVTVRDAPAGRQYVALVDDESELAVLRLTDPRLPAAVRDVLREMASKHPDYLAAADRRGSFVYGNVRVAPDGVFLADLKIVDLEEVIERIARGDVVAITRAVGSRFAIDRPVEVGVGSGGEMSFVSRGGDLRLTVTVPRFGRRSVEGFVGIYRGNNGFDTGIYGFQVKQPIGRRRRPGVEPYATFGLMGLVARDETFDCPYASCRPHKSVHVTPPFLGLAGAGVQYTVTPRLAVRLESQAAVLLFIPVGVRVAAGVSIPLGRATFRRAGL